MFGYGGWVVEDVCVDYVVDYDCGSVLGVEVVKIGW